MNPDNDRCQIGGYEHYAIDRGGIVWSKSSGQWVNLVATPDKDGYPVVCLYSKGKRRAITVHRLVLEAFVGPCPDGMEACHNNGIPDDCRVENLRWGTRLENANDRRIHGTHPGGPSHHWSSIGHETACNVRKLRSAGYSLTRISQLLGIATSSASRILRGLQCR